MSVTRSQAFAAQEKVSDQFMPLPWVVSVGVAMNHGDHVVLMGVKEKPPGVHIPPEVDGVPVLVEYSGPVVAAGK